MIVAGVSGSGKTTVCRQTVALAAARGHSVGGIVTVPRSGTLGELGLDVEDVRRGDRRRLAETTPTADGPVIGQWHFHRSGLEWGDGILASALPCDLLVVDELGPLELVRDDGWAQAMPAVRDGRYGVALAVVRPALVQTLLSRLAGMRVITVAVAPDNRDQLPGEMLIHLDSGS
ncbi:MAG: hypothetical protein IMZ55_17515 [Acidobacteria bacterium]|nr:hypothetical protein [Acidobacteriota bacterium]